MPGKTERQAEVERILLMLAVYFQKKLTDLEIEIYHKGLAGLSIPDLRMAATEAVKTMRFFPKVAELLEIATPKLPALEDRAVIQAAKVMTAVAGFGVCHRPKFDDPITEELLKGRFSWRALCDMNPSEVKWFVKEFVEAYRIFGQDREQAKRLGMPGNIAGLLKGIGAACLIMALWIGPAGAFQYDTTGSGYSTPTDFEVFNGPNPQRGWCDYGSRIVYQTRDYHSNRGAGTGCFFPSGNDFLPDTRPPAPQSIFRDPEWGKAWEGYGSPNEGYGYEGRRP